MTSLAQQSYPAGYARGSPPGFEGDLYLQQQFSRGEMPPRPCRYEDRSPRGESPEGRQSGGEDRPACDYATAPMASTSLHQYSSCISGKIHHSFSMVIFCTSIHYFNIVCLHIRRLFCSHFSLITPFPRLLIEITYHSNYCYYYYKSYNQPLS